METWEEYTGGKRLRGFRFGKEDVKIIVEGSELDEMEAGIDEEYETFYREYEYKDVAKAFRDFAELVEKDWSSVELRIESRENPSLHIVFNRFYFVAEFVADLDALCRDSEKLKEIAKKVEEIRDILRS